MIGGPKAIDVHPAMYYLNLPLGVLAFRANSVGHERAAGDDTVRCAIHLFELAGTICSKDVVVGPEAHRRLWVQAFEKSNRSRIIVYKDDSIEVLRDRQRMFPIRAAGEGPFHSAPPQD